MEIDRRGKWVQVWREDRWDYDTDSEESHEKPPDFVLSEDQMNALVCAWLRGPMGPPGATGPMGNPGRSG